MAPAQLGNGFDHGAVVEFLQLRGVLQVDAARIDRHRALRRHGDHLRRGVAGEDDGVHPALAGLREAVGHQRVGDAVDALRHRVRGGRRDDQRVVEPLVELPDRDRGGGGLLEDARGGGQHLLVLAVHAQHLVGRRRDEQVDIVELADQVDRFGEEVPRAGERPAPARIVAVGDAVLHAANSPSSASIERDRPHRAAKALTDRREMLVHKPVIGPELRRTVRGLHLGGLDQGEARRLQPDGEPGGEAVGGDLPAGRHVGIERQRHRQPQRGVPGGMGLDDAGLLGAGHRAAVRDRRGRRRSAPWRGSPCGARPRRRSRGSAAPRAPYRRTARRPAR